MFKRNSIFMKIFVPIAIIMLLQAAIVNVFLSVSGTIDTLNNNAIDILTMNVQSQSSDIESRMINYWGNIGEFEQSVIEGIAEHLTNRSLDITDVLGSQLQEIDMLYNLAPILKEHLRFSSATGIFVYFLEGNPPAGYAMSDGGHFNGLYLRKSSPASPDSLQSIRNSNLIVVRGHDSIAQRHNLPLDKLWEEVFYFNPQYEGLWNSFVSPQRAVMEFPDAASADLSYWSRPHLLNPRSAYDTNMQITYTRPLIADGRFVAIIGIEIQLSHLKQHFPAYDLDVFSESGFMLLKHKRDNQTADVLSMTGEFLKGLFGERPQITLTETQTPDLFSIAEHPHVRLVTEPIRIYSPNSPFLHEEWALAAVSTTESLFAMSSSVMTSVLYSTVAAVLSGGLLIFIIIRRFSKPIKSVIKQIQDGTGTAILTQSNTYEIDLLCETINDMMSRREQTEARIEKERQLYMLAFTNSADIFAEYHLAEDELFLYFYQNPMQAEPSVKTVDNLLKTISEGVHDVFHKNSWPAIEVLASTIERGSRNVSIRADFFEHIKGMEADNGYLWFSVESIGLCDSDGNVTKIVCAANHITPHILAERASIEASRRDLTTGLFNRAYGLEIGANSGLTLNLVSIINFDKLEMTYGKIFAGIFIAEFARAITSIIQAPDFAIRFSDNQFLIFCRKQRMYDDALLFEFGKLYRGEATEFELRIKIDILADITEAKKYPENPVSAFLDLSNKEKISELALELFKRTIYVNSSIRALISQIGRAFGLDAVIICASNAKLGTNQVTHQWCSRNFEPVSEKVMKVMSSEFDWYNSQLDDDGAMIHTRKNRDLLLEKLLCLTESSASTYCCAMYEAGVDVGRMLFVSSEPKIWVNEDRAALYAVAKIISSYVNAEKSRLASQAKSIILSRISQEKEILLPSNSSAEVTTAAVSLPKPQDNIEEIRNILEISWIESEQLMQAESKSFNLGDFVDEIDNLLRPVFEERRIKFIVDIDVMHQEVSGDTHRLKQVLVNLLDNACKFTEPGGFAGLTITEEIPWQFAFSVKDSGIGIPQEKHSSIFEPFTQMNPAKNVNEQQKKGWGLAIVKNILLAMSSDISFNSLPGMGSDFYFTLNLKPTSQEDRPYF